MNTFGASPSALFQFDKKSCIRRGFWKAWLEKQYREAADDIFFLRPDLSGKTRVTLPATTIACPRARDPWVTEDEKNRGTVGF